MNGQIFYLNEPRKSFQKYFIGGGISPVILIKTDNEEFAFFDNYGKDITAKSITFHDLFKQKK